jgi:monoamine oxidase
VRGRWKDGLLDLSQVNVGLFDGTVRGSTAGVERLVVAATGTATFQGAVGDADQDLNSFDVTAAGTTTSNDVIVDAVILGLPFAVMTDAVDFSQAGFDARKIQAITQLGRGLCSKLQLQFTPRLWNHSGAWGISNGEESFSDNGDQCSWHVTRGQPGTSGILNGYTGGTPTLPGCAS